MKYRVLKDITINGDPHKAGDELRCSCEGSIKAMLRAKQIEVCGSESDFEVWAHARGIKLLGMTSEARNICECAYHNEKRLVDHYERQLKECGARLLESFEEVKKLQADKATLQKLLDDKPADPPAPVVEDKSPPEGDKSEGDKPGKKKADK